MPYNKIDNKKIRTLPLSFRQNKMTVGDIKQLYELDDIDFQNEELDILVQRIIAAHNNQKQVILMMGAHPLRRGNSRFIIDLMERGIVTHIATNGATAIHDFELAFLGGTLEDVDFYVRDGKFGNWKETGEYINRAIKWGYNKGRGFGESIGIMISSEELSYLMPHKDISIFAAAVRLGIPITVHKGIGYDITDQHPSADFSAIGKTSGDDFLVFANSIRKLEGGVFLNIGSQVMGPEVYLKALSMARNLARQDGEEIKHFTTAVFDIVDLGDWRAGNGDVVDCHNPANLQDSRYYFRPFKSILVRTVKDGGESFYIQGDFSVTIPALYKKVISLI